VGERHNCSGPRRAPTVVRLLLLPALTRTSIALPNFDAFNMPNIASVLKDEISRISRKEMRRETSSLKKSSTSHRSDIAALKRRVQELERQLRRLGRAGESSAPAAANEDSISSGTRFSAKSMAAQRKRLGLSAAECGLLIGASSQSIYNWEEGKSRPRAQHLPAIFALRNLGRRQANEILEARKAA
jgi:DNA-binding transcriptional regulator YiaG